jgi:hypothetical protein
MNLQEQSLTLFNLTQLEASYWYDVDTNWGRTAHTYFLDDGEFDLGIGNDTRYTGAEQIRTFYSWREGRGERTARHLMSNVWISPGSGAEATMNYVMSLYAEDGAPVRESRPAIMIADVVVKWVLGSDKRWRIRSRVLKPVFMGGAAPTAMKTQ